MTDIDQLLLNFNQKKNFEKNNFYVTKSNFLAYEILNKWPRWEKNILNIHGEKYSGKGFVVGNAAVCGIGVQKWCNGTQRLVINGQYLVTFYTNTYALSQGNYPNDPAGSMFGISAGRVDHTGPTKDNYSVVGCTTISKGGRMYLFPPNEFYAGWPWWGDFLDKEGNKLWLCGNP